MATNIQISNELWKFLNDKKEVGETFEEVIKRLIKYEKRDIKIEKSKSNQ
jgi:predicted CopG family antitoxin